MGRTTASTARRSSIHQLLNEDPTMPTVEIAQRISASLVAVNRHIAALRDGGDLTAEQVAARRAATQRRERWPREKIISALQDWTRAHGVAPLQRDWLTAGDLHPESSTVSARFGSWAEALRAAGVIEQRQTLGKGGGRGFAVRTADEIIDAALEWIDAYGAAPVLIDWAPHLARLQGRDDIAERFESGHWPTAAAVQHRFGTWNEMLAAAELRSTQAGLKREAPRPARSAPATHSHAWTREEVIAAIVEWERHHGRAPSGPQWQKRDDTGRRPSTKTVWRIFGGWNAALAAAGVAINRAATRTDGANPRAMAERQRQQILAWIAEQPGITVQQLADLAGVDRELMNRRLNKLLDRGLITTDQIVGRRARKNGVISRPG